MNTLHIALITETFAPEINGVAHTLGHLSSGLRQRGHRVAVIRPRQPQDPRHPTQPDLLLCRGWPIPGYPGLQWGQTSVHKLLRRWKQERPDVIYIATEGPLGLSALRAARRLKIPVVSCFHTNYQAYASQYGLGLMERLTTFYLRWFHNRTQLTLVPSLSQRTALQRRGFERLALLERGVDSQLFNPTRRSSALREHWGLQPDDIALIHVGRLAPEKNLGLLRRTFETLRAKQPSRALKLIVVGDGPERAALERELPEAVFCGAQQGEILASHYASGDIFLFPSLTETFGIVVLEAMASGLAVVAYDEAAAAQHIQQGHNGALAMSGDEHAFIEAAGWLLDDPEALRRARLNARHHACHQGWEPIVTAFEEHLYNARQAAAHPGSAALLALKSGSSTR